MDKYWRKLREILGMEGSQASLVAAAFRYKGDIISWPPSDDEVRFRAWLFDQFVKHKMFRLKDRDWSKHRGDSLFGEYYFGIYMGLRGNTRVWEQEYRRDYKVGDITIDVKSIIDPRHRLLRPVHQEDFCDVLVLCLIDPNNLSLSNVSLLGWCYDKEILSAPIEHFSKKDPKKVDAHFLKPCQLSPIETLRKMIESQKPKEKELWDI